MSDATPAPRSPEMRQKRQRLRKVVDRIKRMRDELAVLNSEKKQLRSELPKRASGEGSSTE
jgi:hypothetical protein